MYRDAAGQTLGAVMRFRTSDGGKDDLPHVYWSSSECTTIPAKFKTIKVSGVVAEGKIDQYFISVIFLRIESGTERKAEFKVEEFEWMR